jgi:hypothetical protein
MSTKLHVANLSPAVGSPELARLFAEHGPVLDARVSTYPDSERSTGIAIVDMASEAAGDAAIEALDGQDLGGRPMAVAPATPRDETDAAGTSLFGPMNMVADDAATLRESPTPRPTGHAPARPGPVREGWASTSAGPHDGTISDADALTYLIDGDYLNERAGEPYVPAGGRVSLKFVRGLIAAGHFDDDDGAPVPWNEHGRRASRRGPPGGPH